MCKNSIIMYHLYYLFFLVQLAAFDFFLPKKKKDAKCILSITYTQNSFPLQVKRIQFGSDSLQCKGNHVLSDTNAEKHTMSTTNSTFL